MLGNLSGWHLLIILAVVLLLFGATRLPQLAKGIGQSLKIFRTEVRDEVVATPKQADEAEPTDTRAQ
jgi:sec-independent protein translocase protein TatA